MSNFVIISFYKYFDKLESAAPQMNELMPSVEAIDKMPSPRVIKSHLPFPLLPSNLLDTCKVWSPIDTLKD
jgi:hypothetical protein